jgi:outer membrane protein
MKALFCAAVLSLMLAAAPTFAQTPPPAQPAPKPATPTATPPPAGTTMQAAPQAPAPFPAGAKIAYINIQRIASESAEGKAATAKVQALNQKKVVDLNEKNKLMQADQQKLQAGGTVMSDVARGELEKKIERQRVDIDRYTQDAQQEVQELQQTLQNEFQRKLMPIVQQVAQEKGLQLLFSVVDSGLVWGDPGLDVTADVIKRFDSGPAAAAAPKSESKPPSR